MKIFITGATGFIGRYILEDLINKPDVYIVAPTRNIQKAKALINAKNLKFIHFQEDLDYLVKKEKPNVIINLLGILTENKRKGITYEKVHYLYTKKLVEGAVSVKVEKFLQMSALGVNIKAKSRYFRTKALAEETVINSSIKYSIFRPSIVLGKGQKLFDDLKKFAKLTPVFLAPTGKVQPINVLDVRDIFIKNIFNDFETKILYLCGEKIISYKELFEFVLNYLKVRRKVIQVPNKLFLPLLPFFELLPNPPLTKEQYLMLERDNICGNKNYELKNILGNLRNPFKID